MKKLLLILILCAATVCAQTSSQNYQNNYEYYQLSQMIQEANNASTHAAYSAKFRPVQGPNKYISIYYKDPEHKNPPLLLLFYFGSSVDMTADCSSLDGLRLILKWYYGTVYGK